MSLKKLFPLKTGRNVRPKVGLMTGKFGEDDRRFYPRYVG